MSDPAFAIAAAGMAAHRSAMDAIARNLANAGAASVGSTPDRPRQLFATPTATFADALDDADGFMDFGDLPFDGAGSIGDSDFRFDPANPFALAASEAPGGPAPAADDSIGQMVALVAAGRAYDADVAALQAAKQMDVEAIDMDRS